MQLVAGAGEVAGAAGGTLEAADWRVLWSFGSQNAIRSSKSQVLLTFEKQRFTLNGEAVLKSAYGLPKQAY